MTLYKLISYLIILPTFFMNNTISQLNPDKLNTQYIDGVSREGPIKSRKYTLTHSDTTGDLFLTIGANYNREQISGWYTRFMRDEVLAEWIEDEETYSLHIHCHVSGGLVFGPAGWRYGIFKRHLPMVIEAFVYGDQGLIDNHPELAYSKVFVHFDAVQKKFNRIEDWGTLEDYRYQP